MLAAAIALGLPQPAAAQQPPAAEVTRVVGRVELLRKGQTQWVPAVIGANLVEGDDIRAFSGASAELTLPDTSTVVVAENSRLLLTKLEFDQQSQSRTVMLHLAVGKMRAIIAQAAIALVRARQSNFVITTPTAVAAARGTIVWIATDGAQTFMAVEPQTGIRSRVDCLPLRAVQTGQKATMVSIVAGTMATDCGAPVTLQQNFLNFTNKATENSPVMGAAVVAPSPVLVLQALTASGSPSFTINPLSAPANLNNLSPSTVGQDVTNNLESEAPPAAPVTGPPPR